MSGTNCSRQYFSLSRRGTPSPRVRGEGGVRGPLRWAQNCGAQNRGDAPSPSPRSSRGSTSPRTRGEVRIKIRSRGACASEVCLSHAQERPPKMKGGGAPKGAVVEAASADAAARHANECCHSPALRARAPCGAPPRARFGELTPQLSSSRASWVRRHRVSPASSPVPVQRAPRRPVHHLPAGRCPEPPGSGCIVRPRAPHSLHFRKYPRERSLRERDG